MRHINGILDKYQDDIAYQYCMLNLAGPHYQEQDFSLRLASFQIVMYTTGCTTRQSIYSLNFQLPDYENASARWH